MNERTFAEQLQERARKCGDVYTDRMLLEFFANGVSSEIQDNFREYMCDHPRKNIDEIARHAQSVWRRDVSTFKDKRANDNRNGDKSSKSQSTPSSNAG